jgi:hypothetical protein
MKNYSKIALLASICVANMASIYIIKKRSPRRGMRGREVAKTRKTSLWGAMEKYYCGVRSQFGKTS